MWSKTVKIVKYNFKVVFRCAWCAQNHVKPTFLKSSGQMLYNILIFQIPSVFHLKKKRNPTFFWIILFPLTFAHLYFFTFFYMFLVFIFHNSQLVSLWLRYLDKMTKVSRESFRFYLLLVHPNLCFFSN